MTDNWTVSGDSHDGQLLLGVAEIGGAEPGDPVAIGITNRSGHVMGGVSVGTGGPGKLMLQLARDEQGVPGVWAEIGQEVTPGRRIHRDESFKVWARIIPPAEDEVEPGKVPFNITIKGFAVG